MQNLFHNNDLLALFWRTRFVPLAFLAAALLFVTFAWQAYAVFTAEEAVSDEAIDVRVNIGEMYFEQVDASLPQNVLAAEVGDVIEFHNEGNLRHSVTIEALDFDEVLQPGDSLTLTVEEVLDNVVVNCKFHAAHDALLSVTAAGN